MLTVVIVEWNGGLVLCVHCGMETSSMFASAHVQVFCFVLSFELEPCHKGFHCVCGCVHIVVGVYVYVCLWARMDMHGHM